MVADEAMSLSGHPTEAGAVTPSTRDLGLEDPMQKSKPLLADGTVEVVENGIEPDPVAHALPTFDRSTSAPSGGSTSTAVDEQAISVPPKKISEAIDAPELDVTKNISPISFEGKL